MKIINKIVIKIDKIIFKLWLFLKLNISFNNILNNLEPSKGMIGIKLNNNKG